jgi:glycosyltransferase involved in cell wall biosynthesis
MSAKTNDRLTGNKLTIMAFPMDGDSYTNCHYPAMRKQGANIVKGIFSLRWLMANLRNVDYVHFHWPSFSYRHASGVQSTIRFGKLCFLLLLAKFRGASIIWTSHNLYPHDKNSWPLIDTLARRVVTRIAKHILAHGPSAAEIVAAEFPAARGKITTIWHGHWIDYYRHGCSRRDARARLVIPEDAFAYTFVGLCKEYKNLHELIPTFQSISGTAWLVIAGSFQTKAYQEQIEHLIAQKPERIRFVPGYIPDDDLQVYLAVADMVVVPYLEILTSGSAMLAMSFGRPVIAPCRGYLRDVIPPNIGLLYDPNDRSGLKTAMIDARQRHFDERAILTHAQQYDWDHEARKVIDTLELSRSLP